MSHLDRLLERVPVQPARPLRLHIDRVSVAGLALTPAQSRQFGAALAHELRQLARTPGWPAGAASTALPGVIAPVVTLASDGSPAALGRDVARSLFDAARRAR
jgi:hypothetical protein